MTKTADRGYAICTDARSGSTYLTHLLSSTEVLGRPREYFNPTNLVVRDIAGYGPAMMVQTVLTQGATPNGVYAVKVFADTFDNPQPAWTLALPNLKFVHFEREDLLGQAISWAKAVQTGVYVAGDPTLGEARYDEAVISYFLVEAARRQARWRLFFARNGVTPLRLTYGGVTADPHAAVAAVADLIGEPRPILDLGKVSLVVQRDTVSDQWRERYLEERGDLTRLDAPDIGAGLTLRRWISRLRQRLTRLGG